MPCSHMYTCSPIHSPHEAVNVELALEVGRRGAVVGLLAVVTLGDAGPGREGGRAMPVAGGQSGRGLALGARCKRAARGAECVEAQHACPCRYAAPAIGPTWSRDKPARSRACGTPQHEPGTHNAAASAMYCAALRLAATLQIKPVSWKPKSRTLTRGGWRWRARCSGRRCRW